MDKIYNIAKHWKKILIIGIIILVIGIICMNIFNRNNMENLANIIGTPLVYISFVIIIISLIFYTITKKVETKHIPIWVCVIIGVIIVGVVATIGNNAMKPSQGKRGQAEALNESTKYQNNTTKSSSTQLLTSLVGTHKCINGGTGYLEITEDYEFKIYVTYSTGEKTDIEGTFTIKGNDLSIKVQRQNGLDLGSNSFTDKIVIAEDNIAYGYYLNFDKEVEK